MRPGICSNIAIDVGTAYTRIYQSGKGILLNEPTICAVKSAEGNPVAYGAEAMGMAERTPAEISIKFPVKEGVISDPVLANSMLRHFIKSAMADCLFPKFSKMLVSIPSGSSELAKSAMDEAIRYAGGNNVTLIDSILASAIGSGRDIDTVSGSMIVCLGAGEIEAGVLSCGGIVTVKTSRYAGNRADSEIVRLCREQLDLAIGKPTAQLLKHSLGGLNTPDETEVSIKGRCLATGLPNEKIIRAGDVKAALQIYLENILRLVKEALSETPPELCGDLMETGIVLTGGGARQAGLGQLISQATGLPVEVAEDAELCCVTGAAKKLEQSVKGKKFFPDLPALPLRG